MRKLFTSFVLSISTLSAFAQSYDEKIAEAMNSSDWFALEEICNEAPKDEIWDFLEIYSRCLVGNRLNRPDISIPAFAELLQTQTEELGLENLINSSLMYAMDLSKTGDYKSAAEILARVLEEYKHELDNENISLVQNYTNLYDALSQYDPYSLSFVSDTATIPFSIINYEENDAARLKLDRCTINGIEADITFDTGASVNVISQQMAEKLHLLPLNTSVGVSGIIELSGQYVIAKEMQLGDLTVSDIPFVILPLTTGYEDADEFLSHYGIIVGAPFMLQIKDFTIDFVDNQIVVPANAPELSGQKANMCFGAGQSFLAKGEVAGKTIMMNIDTGDAGFGSLDCNFYNEHREFVEKHGKLNTVGRAGLGGVHKSELYLVSDIPVALGGNTVFPSSLIVETEDVSHITALGFECNIGIKTLSLFSKVRFNLVDFVLSTEPR